jgi:hypothetical protein
MAAGAKPGTPPTRCPKPSDKLVLVLDLFCHGCLLGHTLDEPRVEQLVFALVMDVQCRDAEIDVIGQEPNPP